MLKATRMADNDPNSLIISIVSLVISSLWPVIWAIHVRYRDKIQARQLKQSEITNRFVKDGIQVRAKLSTALPGVHYFHEETLLLATSSSPPWCSGRRL